MRGCRLLNLELLLRRTKAVTEFSGKLLAVRPRENQGFLPAFYVVVDNTQFVVFSESSGAGKASRYSRFGHVQSELEPPGNRQSNISRTFLTPGDSGRRTTADVDASPVCLALFH